MRTVLVLMDTLRREALSCYRPETFVKTPHIDDFAKESAIFDQHWIGSAPCMPARRDILTGRLNFLERSWGPIEPFDITLPQVLKDHHIFSHITTDHCHYLRTGGEGYIQSFNTWDYHRGQEGDPWISRIDEPKNMPETFYGRVRNQYQWNRTQWPNEEDMPSPKTFLSACDWLEDNKHGDDFLLMVEAFDPHEPFDVPDAYMNLYEDTNLDRDYFEIPLYDRVSDALVTDSALDYLNKRYAALVSMVDHYFGKLVEKLKSLDMYEDTMIILTTDHGYFLGERDYLGKNYMHLYNELANLPCLIKYPHGERAGEHIQQITQNIDLMPTILSYAGIDIPESVQGVSLYPLASDSHAKTKEYALYGYHGMAVNVTDGHHTYFRAPIPSNQPCHDYTAMPTTIRNFLGLEHMDEIETGRYFKRTNFPLYKIPIVKPGCLDQKENPLAEIEESLLFDLTKDYAQLHNLTEDKDLEETYIELLRKGLKEYDAPEEQLIRLNIKK